MSRVAPGYLTGLLKIVLEQCLSIAKINSSIRQLLTAQAKKHHQTDLHADNEIPEDFYYTEVFRP